MSRPRNRVVSPVTTELVTVEVETTPDQLLVTATSDEITLSLATSTHLTRRDVEAIDDAREFAERGVDVAGTALDFAQNATEASLIRWLGSHGVEVDDRDDAQLVLRFGDPFQHDNAFRKAIHAGLMVWRHAGLDAHRFKNARVEARVQGYRKVYTGGIPGPPD